MLRIALDNGWFDLDAAEEFKAEPRAFVDSREFALYLTPNGTWVECTEWEDEEGNEFSYRAVDNVQACAWLIEHGHDADERASGLFQATQL